jgi:hypothetical protein
LQVLEELSFEDRTFLIAVINVVCDLLGLETPVQVKPRLNGLVAHLWKRKVKPLN